MRYLIKRFQFGKLFSISSETYTGIFFKRVITAVNLSTDNRKDFMNIIITGKQFFTIVKYQINE